MLNEGSCPDVVDISETLIRVPYKNRFNIYIDMLMPSTLMGLHTGYIIEDELF